MISDFFRLAVGAIAAVALSGCYSSVPVFVEPTAQAILVQPARNELILQSGRSGAGLASSERRRLVDFLHVASNGRVDALHLKVTGLNSRLRRAVVATAGAVGLQPWNIVEVAEPADQHRQSAVRVVADYAVAIPPGCPSLSIVGPSVEDNDFDPTLGCSNRANLALTVNDGHDLLGNPAVVSADAERAAIPVERYRGFVNPSVAARRSSTSSGAASARSATGITGQ